VVQEQAVQEPVPFEPVNQTLSHTPQPPVSAPESTPAETRNRSIYFMQIGYNGAELSEVKVNRNITVSDSPLRDSINALLSGPTAEEKNRGIVCFVPEGTRLLSAMIRGNTAYLNFTEEFQYNTQGREGSLAQIEQIVMTATEFSNVHDVQILIDGKRIDFLSDGVMIGSPLSR
jgi:spore germination protein GerM